MGIPSIARGRHAGAILLAGAALCSPAGAALAAGLPDEPPAAEPISYVRACDAQGKGYFLVPGTDTCMRIDGLVYYEFWVYGSNRASGQPGWYSPNRDGVASYTRGDIKFHTATPTEEGMITTFTELRMSLQSNGPKPEPTYYTLYHAVMTWNGITAGRTQSMFDYFTGSTYASLYEPAWSDTKTNMLAYTYSFGNSGLSVIGSIEDNASRQVGIIDGPGFNLGTANGYAGMRTPDLVGQVNLSQSWGGFQWSIASHQVNTYQNAGIGYDKSALGWATAGGVTVNLPFLGDGDSLVVQAAYGYGALNYVATDPIGGLLLRSGADAAIVVNPNGTKRLDLSRAWSVSGGITHNWSPQWQTNINASYLDVNQLGRFYDFSNIDVQVEHVFMPLANLQIGVEVEYKNIQPTIGSTGNALVGLLHIERDF